MKKMAGVWLSLLLMAGLTGCSIQNEMMQYFFSAKVKEAHEEYLVLEVFDAGSSSLTEDSEVEVSTEVVAADGCPEFIAGESARVVMAWDPDEDSSERLEALAIYRMDDDGNVLTNETIDVPVYPSISNN